MAAAHLEILVEEPSMEAFLRTWLPRLLPEGRSFEVYAFQGKPDLLSKLEPRLRAYATWLPDDWRIVVVVDRDDDDCGYLKRHLEAAARRAGLRSRLRAGRRPWQVVNRIAIEELEAWYFGDWPAVRLAFPRAPARIPRQAAYRDPDAIRGGTWEAFERILQRPGYFPEGLQKIAAARAVAAHVEVERSTSASFRIFAAALQEAMA
jgi:hypothetical protein